MARPHSRGAVPPALLALPLLLLVLPLPLVAQSGPDIMRRALELQSERLSGIEDITVVQETMGMETIQHLEKQEVNGFLTLVPVQTTVAGLSPQVPDMMGGEWSGLHDERWLDRTRLEGTEMLGGRTMHVLVMDDFSGIDLSGFSGGGMENRELRLTRYRTLVDAESLLVRSIQMEGQIQSDGGDWVPIEMDMSLDDYRDIQGYLHPFTTRIRTSGMMALTGVDQEQMSAQMAEMREQLESMPADQRAMIDAMLGDVVDQVGTMMGDDGSMEVVMTVREVRVNEGRLDR